MRGLATAAAVFAALPALSGCLRDAPVTSRLFACQRHEECLTGWLCTGGVCVPAPLGGGTAPAADAGEGDLPDVGLEVGEGADAETSVADGGEDGLADGSDGAEVVVPDGDAGAPPDGETGGSDADGGDGDELDGGGGDADAEPDGGATCGLCDSGDCPDGSTCVEYNLDLFPDSVPFCVKAPCAADSACPDGTSCHPTAAPGGGCVPDTVLACAGDLLGFEDACGQLVASTIACHGRGGCAGGACAAGACANLDDFLAAPDEVAGSKIRGCVGEQCCLQSPCSADCAAACVDKFAPALSDACASCYGAFHACLADECGPDCATSAASCEACADEACRPDFLACSGFDLAY